MATLRQALRNAKKVNPIALENLLFKAIKISERTILRLNRKQIFNNSEDVHGNSPLGTYSLSTQILSGGRKKAGDNYTLFNKGNFLGNMFLKRSGHDILIGTTDSKKDKVFDTLNIFGSPFSTNDIFGLTEENLRSVIRRDLLPLYLKFIRKELNI